MNINHHLSRRRAGLALGLACLMFPSCARDAAGPGGRPSPAAPTAKTLEARLAPAVARRVTELGVPGAIIGVWAKGYEPWKVTLGVADLKTRAPIKLDDVMRIGSITKTFTGTVLLQLADEGKLSLDDSVAKHLPGVPNGEQITVRQLGDMTSGLYNYSEDKKNFGKMFEADPHRSWKPSELIKIAFGHKPYFAPGQGFHYSNTNTFLLGLIIEKLTGHTLPDEIRARITEPLGMRRTTFATDGKMPDPHASGYWYDEDKPDAPAQDVTDWNPSWGWAAGAMLSTLDDLERYAKPLATGGLVSQKSQAERLKWVDAKAPESKVWVGVPLKYGFAIASFGGALGHNGGIPGYQSWMGYSPELETTIIILTNLQDTRDGVEPADNLAKLIIEQLREKS